MVVDTKHGAFEVKDITRKERRQFYKKVKTVYAVADSEKTSENLANLHELGDEFTLLAFGDEKKAEKALSGLSVVQEDEVLNAIIGAYMGIDLGNPTGD